MRGRGLVFVVAVALAGAACSSSAKQAAPARSGAVVGLGTLQPTGSTGVVAVGSATQKVPADLAYVVVAADAANAPTTFPGNISFGPNGQPIVPSSTSTPSTTSTAAEHDKVRAELRPLGIAPAAIEFSRPDPTGSSGDPNAATMKVEVPVAKLPTIASAVVAAIKQAGVTVGGQGLLFRVLDCTAAISTARDEAVADARKHAQALATAAGVSLGGLTSITEQPVEASAFSYLTSNGQSPCGRTSLADVSDVENLTLAAFGAEPEVELTESISESYALATADHTLAANGTGKASGPADSADIIVLGSSEIDLTNPTPSPSTGGKIDEASVLHALAPLGVPTRDIEVENPTNLSVFQSVSSSSYVRVHVTVARLRSIGAEIVSAVQSVAGTGRSSGVIFSASNCTALLARARAAAAADAGARLARLARSARVKTGAVVGVADAGINPYFPAVDPCHPDFDAVTGGGVLSALASGSSGPGIPTLSGLDADPQVTEQATLGISRALGS